jgi:hypothetical protein
MFVWRDARNGIEMSGYGKKTDALGAHAAQQQGYNMGRHDVSHGFGVSHA